MTTPPATATAWAWAAVTRAPNLPAPLRLTLLAVAAYVDDTCARVGGDREHADVLFAARHGVRPHDIAEQVGVTVATTKRYLRELVQRHYLRTDNDHSFALPESAWRP